MKQILELVGCAAIAAVLITCSVGAAAEAQAQEQAKQPRMVFTKTDHDFGTIKSGGRADAVFEFKNAGEAELNITEVISTCGCILTSPSKKVFAPGEGGSLTASLDTTKVAGPFAKTVFVKSNDPSAPQIALTVRGKCVGEVNWAPSPNVIFGNLLANTVATRTAEVWFDDAAVGTRVLEATPASEAFRVSVKEVEQGKRYALEFTTVPPLPAGPMYCVVKVRTDNPKHQLLYCTAHAMVVAAISSYPPQVVVRQQKESIEAVPFVIRHNGDGQFKITKTEVRPEGLQVKVEPLVGNKAYRLRLETAGGSLTFSGNGEVTVHTDNDEVPIVRVPILFQQATEAVAATATANPLLITSGSVRWIPSSTVAFGNVPSGAVTTRTVDIVFDGPDTRVTQVIPTTRAFRATLKETKAGKVYTLEIATVPPLSPGGHDGNILVKTDNPRFATIYCYVSATAVAGVVCEPPEANVQHRGTELIAPVIAVKHSNGNAFRITRTEVNPKVLEVKVETVTEGKVYHLQLEKLAGYDDFLGDVQITIHTDDKQTPVIQLPVRFK